MHDFFTWIRTRESCRDFLDQPVEMEKILSCMETARIAPSATNSQPWHFHIVRNREKAGQVAQALQQAGMNRFTSACPVFIVLCQTTENLLSRIGSKIKAQDFVSLDLGIAATHFCLAATAQGLSTCMIGWFDEAALRRLLSIPSSKRIRLVIALGYAAKNTLRPKNRKALDEIMTDWP